MTHMTKSLTFVTLTLATLTACNNHPIKDAEMNGWEGEGINVGDTDGEDDDGGADGADEGGDAGADDGGAADGGDDGTITGTAVACAADEYEVEQLRPAVMLVLDKSGSMFDNEWNVGGQMVTRWNSLHGVVSDVASTSDATMSLGVTLFPAKDNHGCGVASDPDLAIADTNTAADVLAAIPGANADHHGYTPMRSGLETARAALSDIDASRPRAMVLVTDGLANCVDDQENGDYDAGIEDLVKDIHEQDEISTYVVGIDISHSYDNDAGVVPHDAISAVANAGGVPASDEQPYYAAADEAALYDALDAIANRVECTIQLNAPVAADATFEVTVGDELVSEVASCDEGDGWRFTDPAMRSSIELCGAACDDLRIQGMVRTEACEELDHEPEGSDPTPLPVP